MQRTSEGGNGNHSVSLPINLIKIKADQMLPSPYIKIVSEHDQKIPQSQTAVKPMTPRGRATQQSQDTRKTNKAKQPALSSPSR